MAVNNAFLRALLMSEDGRAPRYRRIAACGETQPGPHDPASDVLA
jgi:hypothetical protein